MNPDNVKDVIDGMYGVVNEGGTGVRAQIPGMTVCGKTGTAQLASYDYMRANHTGNEMKENAWFVGFAPRDNPEIAVVALYEHGGFGQFAAPIVRDVMKAYFDKKARLLALQQEKTRLNIMGSLGLPGPGRAPSAGGAPPVNGNQAPVEAAEAEAVTPASPEKSAEKKQ